MKLWITYKKDKRETNTATSNIQEYLEHFINFGKFEELEKRLGKTPQKKTGSIRKNGMGLSLRRLLLPTHLSRRRRRRRRRKKKEKKLPLPHTSEEKEENNDNLTLALNYMREKMEDNENTAASVASSAFSFVSNIASQTSSEDIIDTTVNQHKQSLKTHLTTSPSKCDCDSEQAETKQIFQELTAPILGLIRPQMDPERRQNIMHSFEKKKSCKQTMFYTTPHQGSYSHHSVKESFQEKIQKRTRLFHK